MTPPKNAMAAYAIIQLMHASTVEAIPDSKVHGANMGPIWGQQDPGGPHVGPMNFAIWYGKRGRGTEHGVGYLISYATWYIDVYIAHINMFFALNAMLIEQIWCATSILLRCQ